MNIASRGMAVIVTGVLLHACATGPVFVSSTAPNAATLQAAQYRNRAFSETGPSGTVYTKEIWEQFKVYRIDDLSVARETVKLDPGLRRLLVRAYFNQLDNTGLFYEGWVKLDVNVQPGVSYILNGRTKAWRIVEVWLEDATGNRASEVGTAPSRLLHPDPFIPVPLRR